MDGASSVKRGGSGFLFFLFRGRRGFLPAAPHGQRQHAKVGRKENVELVSSVPGQQKVDNGSQYEKFSDHGRVRFFRVADTARFSDQAAGSTAKYRPDAV